MCFARKSWLGHFNATRREWREAYRAARVNAGLGKEPDPTNSGVGWKAELIVFGRGQIDPLTISGTARLYAERAINEILNEQ